MDFRIDVVMRYLPLLMQGLRITIQLSVIAVGVGTVIGLFISLMRLSKIAPLRWIARGYVDFIRGTPLMAQIFLIHFGVPPLLGLSAFNPMLSGTIALSLNSGAYVAEIFRGAIQSIEKGQMEAARSLGMTHSQSMKYIIIPQAFKRAIPPLGNEFIAILKDSSLVSVISLQDLMMSGRMMQARSFRPFETWLAVSIFYLIMTMSLSQFVSYLERRYSKSDNN
ncbi:amino acid ABC transporter permease [Serpentinicella sp. ANB-PHB4]|uniref:amino acid ABC transporter permease n=1 Tax=Serpentinicella sp. ANB-PHB4 TaxID=3074076 RepID=UPI002865A188|nr:amino acid ABC transporter permease [Serpentinicella sp. ANB-PHB4]MDR5658734.1 amino acid ABC transporter permease [Serpentinicella sp. ANB-PHB4]